MGYGADRELRGDDDATPSGSWPICVGLSAGWHLRLFVFIRCADAGPCALRVGAKSSRRSLEANNMNSRG